MRLNNNYVNNTLTLFRFFSSIQGGRRLYDAVTTESWPFYRFMEIQLYGSR